MDSGPLQGFHTMQGRAEAQSLLQGSLITLTFLRSLPSPEAGLSGAFPLGEKPSQPEQPTVGRHMPSVILPLGKGRSWRPQLQLGPLMSGLPWMARMTLPYP